MKCLMECVPNFSEGRDASKVDALVAAMRSVPGVWVLDRTSDADHNRSVITLAGPPEAVAEAALRGVGRAAELIDLTRHTGVHPRIGATDVVPFVPLEGCSLEDCVAVARRVGRQIWERYRIPVYFYQAAAMRPERVLLENVRRGQFEGLRAEVLRGPDHAPDVGEPRLHATAGAVAVGARKLLIAYNINLNTGEIAIAKKIAKAIRFSSGGLPGVKAIGVDLKSRNLAQVSIDLTDFEQTPLHRVFETVRNEAKRHGCAILGSEIVGLIPRKAIEQASEFYLQFENFSPALVLENRLAAVQQSPLDRVAGLGSLAAQVQPFLDAVAEPAAAPGSGVVGVVAALAAALAASLGEMVAGLARKEISQAAFEEVLTTLIAALREASERLTAAIDCDAGAFAALILARNLPQETPEERARRDGEIDRATRRIAEIRLDIALAAADVFERLTQLDPFAPPSMRSDLRLGCLLATAAARGVLENMTLHLASLEDSAYTSEIKSRAAAVEARLAPAAAKD